MHDFTQNIVREMAEQYNEWLASLIGPMVPGEILCVHSTPVEQTSSFKLVNAITYHTLKVGELCAEMVEKTQYLRS